MAEQDPKRLDGLFDELQRIQQHLGKAADLIEDMMHRVSWQIQENRKTNACAIAEMIEEALRSKQVPGSRHEISIDGSHFCFTKELGMEQEHEMEQTGLPDDDIPF